ncbi:hypothetical protein BLA13014_05784 [Burkholderia aenigmatica]|uniref:Uncharacterized protein n=1 Tax=Burkholderia aenigmatica TaxID=2015348 RepID=A0A6P2QPS9_9BURK|nr:MULTISPECIES: hypothetical protein [Burkholderia]VWC22244.1 hypothetical protein BLA13014_05784 [Burkholderia aenigmatica]
MASLHSDAGIPANHWHQVTLGMLIAQEDPRAWRGYSTEAWARSWGNHELAARCAAHPELRRKLRRDETWTMCHDAVIDPDLLVYAVLAYGGANMGPGGRNNWRVAESMPNLLPLLAELPTLTRAEAYERFRHLRRRRLLRGIGPSFFTKIMYFFGCKGAYILDQWLAKSILALRAQNWRAGACAEPVFELIDGNGIRLSFGQGEGIRDSVSGFDYDFFCRELEALTEKLGLPDGAEVERWVFSSPQSDWRLFLNTLDWTSPGTHKKRRDAAARYLASRRALRAEVAAMSFQIILGNHACA